jgi:hypothetical protein
MMTLLVSYVNTVHNFIGLKMLYLSMNMYNHMENYDL